jgi:hypothetical protein
VLGQNRDPQTDRGGQYAGSLDARQHGYEHAYRDGADRGRMDRERKAGYHPQNSDSQNGTLGYETYFGSKTQYVQGYRDGYKAGYDDGYNGRPGQYSQVYGRRPNEVPPAPAPDRQDPYAARSFAAPDVAFDSGYRDGVTLGQQDQQRSRRPDIRDTDAYRNADLGYRSNYGDKGEYQQKYRDGIERGYQDGYGRSRTPSEGAGAYAPRPGNTGVAGTRGAQNTAPVTLNVPANQQWTSTNVRVSSGEVVRFQVTGEIHFTANPNDRAISAGSVTPKFVAGSPIPSALAGALIGRIDNGQPFGIGNQASITMPAGGTLFLGVNDDNVADNSGQFQVVLSR